MPLPKSVTKIKKKNVEFTSSVDRAKYTLRELTRAALRDIAKFILRRIFQRAYARANRSLRSSNRIRRAFQYWNRKRETDLLIGIGNMKEEFQHNAWYGIKQELGTDGQPKRGILRNTVFENIDIIEQIQAQYLKHIEDERTARSLIDENAEVDPNDQDS